MFEPLLKVIVNDDPLPGPCQDCNETYCPGPTSCNNVASEIIMLQARSAAEVEYEAETEIHDGFDFFESCIVGIGCDWFPDGWTSEKIRPVFNNHAARFYSALLEG